MYKRLSTECWFYFIHACYAFSRYTKINKVDKTKLCNVCFVLIKEFYFQLKKITLNLEITCFVTLFKQNCVIYCIYYGGWFWPCRSGRFKWNTKKRQVRAPKWRRNLRGLKTHTTKLYLSCCRRYLSFPFRVSVSASFIKKCISSIDYNTSICNSLYFYPHTNLYSRKFVRSFTDDNKRQEWSWIYLQFILN